MAGGTLPLLLCQRRTPVWVRNVEDSVPLEDTAVSVSLSAKLEAAQFRPEPVRNVGTAVGVHAAAGQAKPPIDAVNAQVCRLNSVRHVGRDAGACRNPVIRNAASRRLNRHSAGRYCTPSGNPYPGSAPSWNTRPSGGPGPTSRTLPELTLGPL